MCFKLQNLVHRYFFIFTSINSIRIKIKYWYLFVQFRNIPWIRNLRRQIKYHSLALKSSIEFLPIPNSLFLPILNISCLFETFCNSVKQWKCANNLKQPFLLHWNQILETILSSRLELNFMWVRGLERPLKKFLWRTKEITSVFAFEIHWLTNVSMFIAVVIAKNKTVKCWPES